MEGPRLTLLVDNQAEPGLAAEHGLAIWIEVADRRLLFDTGQGPALAFNAARLGLDLARTDQLILSHGHYDHGGGVALVLARAPGAVLHCHPAALGPHHACRPGESRPIGLPPQVRTAIEGLAPGRLQLVTRPGELLEGVGLSGPIPRRTAYEDPGGPFFLDPEGRRPDPIEDDLALWLRTPRGLVVVVGCSHAGLINTLEHVRAEAGVDRLHAVVGGFHLLGAGQQRLERTLQALADLAPERIVACHCTGEQPLRSMQQRLGDRVVAGAAGQRI